MCFNVYAALSIATYNEVYVNFSVLEKYTCKRKLYSLNFLRTGSHKMLWTHYVLLIERAGRVFSVELYVFFFYFVVLLLVHFVTCIHFIVNMQGYLKEWYSIPRNYIQKEEIFLNYIAHRWWWLAFVKIIINLLLPAECACRSLMYKTMLWTSQCRIIANFHSLNGILDG